jgi:hypothetical protein
MKMEMPPQSHALVIETNNLHGGRGAIVASLARLLAHLRRQTHPLTSLAELVVTHEGTISDAQIPTLQNACGRRITFVETEDGAGYYHAKERGFDATNAAVVVFADGDCWPENDWLACMLAPFADGKATPPVDVVAGRTVYRPDLLGIAATTIDFMYFSSPFGAHTSRNFYANNVAFRREVFDRLRYAGDGFYRGNCQVAGMKLVEQGVPVHFVPAARTTHRFPDSARELVQLRLLRGEDTVVLTRHLRERALPQRARWLMDLGPASPALVLGARLACSVAALNRQDMPEVRGARRAAALGLIAGLSLLDAAGAVRGLLPKRERDRTAHKTTTLSYHGDGDLLA